MKKIRCADCGEVITQNKFEVFGGKAYHLEFSQCFSALKKHIKALKDKTLRTLK